MNRKKKNNMLTIILTTITVAIILAFVCGASYLITAGLVYLICKCFGLMFAWRYATGVWLILVLINTLTGSVKVTKKD